MPVVYAVNVPVASPAEVLLCGYHFLSYCARYPIVATSSNVFANSIVLETSTGRTNAASPSRLFATHAIFTVSHVGKYVAVYDPMNPDNTALVRITAFVSATEVQCNAPVTNFTISATNVNLRIFSLTTAPVAGDYFVFSNLPDVTPTWQAKAILDAGQSAIGYEVGPIGGYNAGTNTWLGPVTSRMFGWTTTNQAFFVADSTQGWFLTWTEDVGGVGANRNATWLGTVGSTHATPLTGFPADTSCAGILGTPAAAVNANINQSTGVLTYISTGEFGNADGSGVITGYLTHRQTITGGVDLLGVAAAATNPRTGVQDDFDFILVHRSPQAIRGYIHGLRLLNTSTVNRTLISGGATYVLGNGFGVVRNGKPAV